MLTMIQLDRMYKCASLLIIALACIVMASCVNKDEESSKYKKQIENQAALLNKKCPIKEEPGVLTSVTFANDTLLYHISVTDEELVRIDLDKNRQKTIETSTEKLKISLIKGKCCLTKRWVAPNDSSAITILPSEFGNIESKEK